MRDLSLKQEYRSDKDDVVSEFFIPCLTNSIQYDRTIEYITVKSLSTLTFGLENIQDHHAKIRLISGHRFSTHDLDAITKLFDHHEKRRFNGHLLRDNKIGKIILDKKIENLIIDDKIQQLESIIRDYKLEVKVAIPNSEYVDGVFEERLGIFRDTTDDLRIFILVLFPASKTILFLAILTIFPTTPPLVITLSPFFKFSNILVKAFCCLI